MSTHNSKLAWLIGLGAISGFALASTLWHFLSMPTSNATSLKSEATDNLEVDSTPHNPQPPARPPKHRSPEDDIPLTDLATLIHHSTHEIRLAAQRTILTRLTRHRIFAPLHALMTSNVTPASLNTPGHDFHAALRILEDYGWAGQGQIDEADFAADRRHMVPAETWARIVEGFPQWRTAWTEMCKDVGEGRGKEVVLSRGPSGMMATDGTTRLGNIPEAYPREGGGVGGGDVTGVELGLRRMAIAHHAAAQEQLLVPRTTADGDVAHVNASVTAEGELILEEQRHLQETESVVEE